MSHALPPLPEWLSRKIAAQTRPRHFEPKMQSELKRWYRLASSTANAGEYDSVTEIYGGSSITQPGAVRKPAAATSTNGLPVATFDGTDVWLMPLEAGNVGTSKWWMFFQVKLADFAATQHLYNVMSNGAASVSRARLSLQVTTGLPLFDIFTSGFNGRSYLAAGALTAAVWSSVYVQFDSTRTAECDTDGATADAKLRLAINGTFQALTASTIGTSSAPTSLLAATGNAIIGGATDSDTPSAGIRNGGQFADLFFGDEPLSAFKLSKFNSYEVRT